MRQSRCLLLFCALLNSIGCAQVATVKEVRLKDERVRGESRDPMDILEDQLDLAESAWRKLHLDPADKVARGGYNRATARLFGVMREAGPPSGKGPVQIGQRTLTWRKESRKEWDPALYELIPAGQLEIGGTPT
jgi:hypothetical protein